MKGLEIGNYSRKKDTVDKIYLAYIIINITSTAVKSALKNRG